LFKHAGSLINGHGFQRHGVGPIVDHPSAIERKCRIVKLMIINRINRGFGGAALLVPLCFSRYAVLIENLMAE
jgi:hypothetical protein